MINAMEAAKAMATSPPLTSPHSDDGSEMDFFISASLTQAFISFYEAHEVVVHARTVFSVESHP